MKTHKYDKLLQMAKELSDETGCSALVLIEEGDDCGCLCTTKGSGLADMLRSLMAESREVAEIIVGVAGNYVKERMAESLEGKAALRKAYEEAKKKAS